MSNKNREYMITTVDAETTDSLCGGNRLAYFPMNGQKTFEILGS
jgi:hypothetical protein